MCPITGYVTNPSFLSRIWLKYSYFGCHPREFMFLNASWRCSFPLPCDPSIFLSPILQFLCFSNLYGSGNSYFRVSLPIHLSYQNSVLSPAPTCFLITWLMFILVFNKSSLTPTMLFQTLVIVFFNMQYAALLMRLWMLIIALLHILFLSILILHHHLIINERFIALNEPRPRAPGSLEDMTFFQETQLTFLFPSSLTRHTNFLLILSSVLMTPIGAKNSKK